MLNFLPVGRCRSIWSALAARRIVPAKDRANPDD